MKKLCFGLVATILVVGLSGIAQADLIKQIYIGQASGVTAEYSSSSREITWSGGAIGRAEVDGIGTIYFGTVDVTGGVTDMTNRSSGGLAAASFATGSFSITASDGMLYGFQPVPGSFTVTGHVENVYKEDELNVTANELNGRSIVIVDTFTYSLGSAYAWLGGTGDQAGLIVDSGVLDSPADFVDYATQDYSASNVTISLYADESIIPEPATIALLSLGVLALRRKRLS